MGVIDIIGIVCFLIALLLTLNSVRDAAMKLIKMHRQKVEFTSNIVMLVFAMIFYWTAVILLGV